MSIVVCTYNGAKYLKQQIEGLVGQTYPVAEIIVQDDGSTDETPDILREYAAEYDFFRVCQTADRGGGNAQFY